MKKLFFLLLLMSCSSARVHTKKVYLHDLIKNNELYRVENNSYFYFMIDSTNKKHLVKMNLLNSDRVLWIEKLNKVNK